MENSRMVEMKREDVVRMENEKRRKRKRMMLRLNYEAVIAAWASRGSPWKHGIRTQGFNLDEIFMRGGDGGRREARVLRYREKRRTRLLSKKIRYKVRKLNADNRPRIKGRFVKTTPQYLSSSLILTLNTTSDINEYYREKLVQIEKRYSSCLIMFIRRNHNREYGALDPMRFMINFLFFIFM